MEIILGIIIVCFSFAMLLWRIRENPSELVGLVLVLSVVLGHNYFVPNSAFSPFVPGFLSPPLKNVCRECEKKLKGWLKPPSYDREDCTSSLTINPTIDKLNEFREGLDSSASESRFMGAPSVSFLLLMAEVDYEREGNTGMGISMVDLKFRPDNIHGSYHVRCEVLHYPKGSIFGLGRGAVILKKSSLASGR